MSTLPRIFSVRALRWVALMLSDSRDSMSRKSGGMRYAGFCVGLRVSPDKIMGVSRLYTQLGYELGLMLRRLISFRAVWVMSS